MILNTREAKKQLIDLLRTFAKNLTELINQKTED